MNTSSDPSRLQEDLRPELHAFQHETMLPTPKRIRVIGLGNVLMGDDGFGPLTVERFHCEYECGLNVEVIDLGTPGLDLAPYLHATDLVVIADAVHSLEKPGALCIYCEDDLLTHRAQLRLTAHDPGLVESLAHLRLAGEIPSELIIVGVVPESCEFGKPISPAVFSASSIAVEKIAGLLVERSVSCFRRPAALPPNLWWLSGELPKAPLPRLRLGLPPNNHALPS